MLDDEQPGLKEWRLTQRRFPCLGPAVALFLVYVVGHGDELRVVQVIGEIFALGGCPARSARLRLESTFTTIVVESAKQTFHAFDRGTM